MKAKKWIIACACFAGSAFAADVLQFDVVIRDFSVEHSDFENYSEEYAAGHGTDIRSYGMVGYGADWYSRGTLHSTCGNSSSDVGAKIGIDGKPMAVNKRLPEYLRDVSAGAALKYGECADKSRGYSNGQKSPLESIKMASCASAGAWANEVYYTPGMVQSYLKFDAKKSDGEYDMYDGVHIQKLADLCDNGHFDQWYEDVDGVNYRIGMTLDLPSVGRNLYQVNYNYNNGGFAPLDSVVDSRYKGKPACNPAAQIKGKSSTLVNSSCTQWGPQSLTIYCPPYKYEYASSQTDASGKNTADFCTQWLANGGPKSPTAAQKVEAKQYLRNYSYTMMGYVKFKYKATNQENGGEVFEFVADDDMWVFVDGVLVEDRGGVHSTAPAPGAVNIKTLAMNNHGCHAGEPLANYTNCEGASDATGWGENSWHHLHFFYAKRQNSGASNLLIRSSIAEVAPLKYGGTSITQAAATIKKGQSIISVTMNTSLSAETMSALAQQAAANKNVLVGNKVDPATTKYAMLVKRVVEGEDRERVFGLLLAGVSEKSVNGGSATYEFKGVLVDENGNVYGNIRNGDGIAFNYRGTEGSDNMVYEYWNTHAISIESISGKKVEFFPNEWTKVAYYDAADYDAAGVVGTPKISGGLSVSLRGNTLQVNTTRTGLLKVQVFDMVGHVVESLNENVPAGNFAYTFGKMGKGAYIVRVQQGAMVRTIRK